MNLEDYIQAYNNNAGEELNIAAELEVTPSVLHDWIDSLTKNEYEYIEQEINCLNYLVIMGLHTTASYQYNHIMNNQPSFNPFIPPQKSHQPQDTYTTPPAPHGEQYQQPPTQQYYQQLPPPQQYRQPYYQPQPRQPYYRPEEPKKPVKKWPWAIAATFTVFLIIGALTSGNDNDQATTQVAATTTRNSGGSNDNNANSKQSPGIGQEVHDGKFGFIVRNVAPGVPTIGNVLTETAQGKFVVVTVDVTNTSDQPQSYFGDNQKLKDTQGRSFSNDTSAEITLQGSNFTVGDINPGNTATVKIVFDIPKDAQPSEIEFHDSFFSGGATVSLT